MKIFAKTITLNQNGGESSLFTSIDYMSVVKVIHTNIWVWLKYACRKSLADSRPRIRGRFARYNDNPAKNCPMQWSHEQKEEEEEEANNGGENWIKYFIDAYSSANLIP